jgi:tRNA pseudouridine55 synthase
MIVTKKTKQINSTKISEGFVLLIDKEKSKTSFDVIREIRRKFKVKKVGHAGTLDPMATGLLIVCLGKKTKEIYKYQDMAKVYKGTITLGKTTPSMDGETEPISVNNFDNITNEQIENVKNSFMGEIEQIPPMYSAIKHKGKSLYKYARKGIDIERSPRNVTIYNFLIEKVNLPEISFEIECSKGTYIRVIANDFGNSLGCGAYLSELRRTKIGNYDVENSINIKELNDIECFEDEITELV